jgi:ATP-dependent Lhr-like helicase
MMEAYLAGKSGLLNAPTGAGKTYAMWVPILLDYIQRHPKDYQQEKKKEGLQALWLTPLRALAKDSTQALAEACIDMQLPWRVEGRTGDTSTSKRAKQKKHMPQGLVTTPESLHVLFGSKDHLKLFQELRVIVVDEWHELIGTKRGVQVELAIAHLRQVNPNLQVWGISATIGNLAQAGEVLLGTQNRRDTVTMVRADLRKHIQVESLLPDTLDKFPWAGHLGTDMAEHMLPIIRQSRTSLIFTNTRAQCEFWYQALLTHEPDLAGQMAMHHGSIDRNIRDWVEEALHNEELKVVICTSSLDLGVDFRPVETIFQIGGPKGVARFMQRAGRSGHQPGAVSKIYFVPTHSLELLEAAALREGVARQLLEARVPMVLAYDVLIQYLLVRAVSDGFQPEELFAEITQTYAYQHLSREDWDWLLVFITTGGQSLRAYEAYQKVDIEADGSYRVNDKSIARQIRLSIGTIVGEVTLTVKFMSGGRIGSVPESFITQVNDGDKFWFNGRLLELVRVRHNEVLVKKARGSKGKVPRWLGSRMQLSSQMADILRGKLSEYLAGAREPVELAKLSPLLDLQVRWSAIPLRSECLIELIKSREGWHLFVYPFEGRHVHEILGAVCAWRMAQLTPITFSIAMNDYGFELLSDQEIPIEEALAAGLFATDTLQADLARSLNETEMAQRRFREIASISGLVFKGYPGKALKSKHLQASSNLLFQVFKQYDADNLLLKQAVTEVIDYQVGGDRLHAAMQRLQGQSVLLQRPHRFTPFCFPIMIDRLRERLSSEKLADRVARMTVQLEQAAG